MPHSLWEACGSANPWGFGVVVTVLVVGPLVEYWLGKTERVRAGSMVELAVMGAVMIFTAIFKRRTDNGKDSEAS